MSITLPLSLPGVIAGSMLVFIPAVGEFVIPRLLGGTDSLMIGRVLWDEYFINRNWPVASAVAIALLFLLVIPIMIFQRYQMQEAAGRRGDEQQSLDIPADARSSSGFAFLYIPILSMIVYSFNESRLVTVWGGFSTKWYGELFEIVRCSKPPG